MSLWANRRSLILDVCLYMSMSVLLVLYIDSSLHVTSRRSSIILRSFFTGRDSCQTFFPFHHSIPQSVCSSWRYMLFMLVSCFPSSWFLSLARFGQRPLCYIFCYRQTFVVQGFISISFQMQSTKTFKLVCFMSSCVTLCVSLRGQNPCYTL